MARSPFWRIETPAIFVLAYFFVAPVPFTGAQGEGTPKGKEVSTAVKAEKREYVSSSGGYRIACPEDVFFFFSVMLAFIGIIGEYIGAIYT